MADHYDLVLERVLAPEAELDPADLRARADTTQRILRREGRRGQQRPPEHRRPCPLKTHGAPEAARWSAGCRRAAWPAATG